MTLSKLLFGRSGGYWLFWTSAIYLAVGLPCALYYKEEIRTEYIQLVWLLFLVMPFAIPPLGRWLNMDVTWDKDMFNLFGKKSKDETNVVKFPKLADPTPPTPEPEKEEPAKIYYRLGLTDNNRVAFSMGYSEITMNKAGCQQMIDQLKFFKSQLYDEGPSGGGPDGGEPLPIPEKEDTEVKSKKAA